MTNSCGGDGNDYINGGGGGGYIDGDDVDNVYNHNDGESKCGSM